MTLEKLPARIRRKIDVDHAGCWLWRAAKNGKGYGLVNDQGRTRTAHRYVFELLRGPLIEGLVIDHLCRVRHCVNPQHMEQVTQCENSMRGDTVNARNAAKTHCPKGHALSGANLVPWAHRRSCLTCKRANQRAYKARRRAREARGQHV